MDPWEGIFFYLLDTVVHAELPQKGKRKRNRERNRVLGID
jgi:hypothetical protein